MNQLTIGVAGHIDHGKTSLVESLTGKNTDNLKEEIKRGMTINIGFAHLNKTISLIDVPGHEKFIKNMVSGVSSIDFAILVIAADDGIMPQTIEHLEILNLLDIKNGLIVLNKIDLAESDEWIELVELEIHETIKETFLDGTKILRTSTITGEGIDVLKNELINLEKEKYKKFRRDIFRMFIDRTFTVKGFGTIVTGTISSGTINKGDDLELLPSCNKVKVRGLQSHDADVESLDSGSRVAINLHFNDKIKIKRGYHLSAQGYFEITKIIAVRLKLLSKTKKFNIKNNQRVRINIGTQESIGRILLIEKDFISSSVVIIKLEREIVVSFKDKFILRAFSPITTIAGGEVLDCNIIGKWNEIKFYAKKLSNSKTDSDIINTILENNFKIIYSYSTLSKKVGLSKELLKEYLSKSKNLVYFGKNKEWILTNEQYDFFKHEIINFLINSHEKYKYREGVIKEEINEKLKLNISFLESMLESLCQIKRIKCRNDLYSKFNFKIQLSIEEIKLKDDILMILNKEGFNCSGIDELSNILKKDKTLISKLLKIESTSKNIIIINEKIFLTNRNYDKLLKNIYKHFEKLDTLNIKQFKDMLNTTRKYAVPLLEYLDKQKITFRIGNERKINK